MTVRLIAKTVPVEDFALETGCDDAEDLISYCARVSNPSNQTNFDTAEKLLKYCIRKAHWSVFEMADAVFEIKCTRDIGRQILRHRSFCYQEFSQDTPNQTPKSLLFGNVVSRMPQIASLRLKWI